MAQSLIKPAEIGVAETEALVVKGQVAPPALSQQSVNLEGPFEVGDGLLVFALFVQLRGSVEGSIGFLGRIREEKGGAQQAEEKRQKDFQRYRRSRHYSRRLMIVTVSFL